MDGCHSAPLEAVQRDHSCKKASAGAEGFVKGDGQPCASAQESQSHRRGSEVESISALKQKYLFQEALCGKLTYKNMLANATFEVHACPAKKRQACSATQFAGGKTQCSISWMLPCAVFTYSVVHLYSLNPASCFTSDMGFFSR